MEYVTYVLTGFLLSMILCFASLKLFSNSFYPIQMPVLLQYIIVIIGVVFTALILVLALAFVSVNSMFKKDIADTIRNKE
jgi:ABC-type antimicrobial peptide transport system permease subunit